MLKLARNGRCSAHDSMAGSLLTTTTVSQMQSSWRSDIDSLSFRPPGHGGDCIVHRRAFRTLLGFNPSPQDCATCFAERRAAFLGAAAAKIARERLGTDANFHLTSRDVARFPEPP
jgi:hypothetical protein